MSSASDFVIENGVLTKYKGPGEIVFIPEGVTEIGCRAFYKCTNLTGVKIPEGVTRINLEAFRGCHNLGAIAIPSSVTEVGLDAFLDCKHLQAVMIADLAAWCRIKFTWQLFDYSSNPLSYANNLYLGKTLLRDLVVPEGVAAIGDSAFRGCRSLKSVVIPNGVEEIGEEAFSYCSNLACITIPRGVKRVGKNAFLHCGELTKVTTIDLAAWCGIDFSDNPFSLAHSHDLYHEENRVEDLFIPSGVTKVEKFAFSNCSSIVKVVIPESVRSIGESAFSGCDQLTSITIPDSVTSVGKRAFSGCRLLKECKIPTSVANIEDDTFSSCSSLSDITVSKSVRRIGARAFNNCGNLVGVILPDGLTSIGDFAFLGCEKITSITIPDSVTDIGEMAFDEKVNIFIRDISRLPTKLRKSKALQFIKDDGQQNDPGYTSCCKYIKTNCVKLLSDIISDPTQISLLCRESLIPPKNVGLFVEAAQKTGNAEVIAIMLDYQANKISDKEKECVERQRDKGQDTIVDRIAARSGKEGIKGLNIAVTGKLETFENRDALKRFVLEHGAKLASSLTAKVDYLIMNDPESDGIKAKKAQELGVEIIAERLFNELASRLFEMDGATIIKYCGKGGNITIPDNTTTIGELAFYGNSSLTSIKIPNSVTSIGRSSFENCSGLTQLTIPMSVTSIGECAFYGCKGLMDVAIMENVTSIGNGAFSGCINLKSVIIPSSMTEIGNAAFYGCIGLTEISIPKTVNKVGIEAFKLCPNLTIHAPAGSYAEQYAKENNIPFVEE